MIFDPIEMITFLFAFIAFVFIALEVANSTTKAKHFWKYFLIIAGLILANRFFTNIESLFLGELFNILEHVSMTGAAVVFFYVVWKLHQSTWTLPS